jgi:hypothetical protein
VRKALLRKADEIDVPYEWWKVPILGYNSSKFDLNLILKELNCKEWTILPNELMVGSISTFQKIEVEHNKSGIVLVFLDAKNFVVGGSLADFVKDFGNGLVSKSQFAYEAVNSENYDEILRSTEPFTREQFYSMLRRKKISEGEYKEYTKDWNEIAKEHELKYKTKFSRWDYLERYNKNDVEIMIPPVCDLIQKGFNAQVDMLQNSSLASVSIRQ